MPQQTSSYKLLLFILALVCRGAGLYSQTAIEPGKLKQFNITVNAEDNTVKTQMLSTNKDIKLNNKRVYLWYGSQKLMETRGGYAGKLIHGYYRSFYLNNQLKEQGQVRYGLKNKEWKYWYPDGNLKEVIHWKKGVKNGSYTLYNDYGQIIAKSRFRNDKLHGRFYTYAPTGKVTDTKRYRNGDEVLAKIKPVKPKKEKPIKEKIIKEKKEKPVKEKIIKEKKTKPSTGKQKTPSDTAAKKPSFFKQLFKKKTPATKPVQPPVENRKVINS